MPKDTTSRKSHKKSKSRSRPYRWDRMGSPVTDPTPWMKTNNRDAQKYDRLAAEVETGEYNTLPDRWKCDRCTKGKWPCMFRRGVGAACCFGCSHSKLKCLRGGLEPDAFLRQNGLLSPSPPSLRQATTPAPPKCEAPGIPTPPNSQPQVRARARSAAPPLRLRLNAPSPSHTEEDTDVETDDGSVRAPVLPRGSAAPSRLLPPLELLSLERRATLPPRRPTTPEHSSRRVTSAPPSPTPPASFDTHSPGTILLRPESGWRVPFLQPHHPDPDEARVVRLLGQQPKYMWRSSAECRKARLAGCRTLFGDVWVPKRGGVVCAPACLHCQAAGRECLWIVRARDDIFALRRIHLTVLAEKGLGAAVVIKDADVEYASSVREYAAALHAGHGRDWVQAWEFALPALYSTAERHGLIDQPHNVGSLTGCRSYVLADDRIERASLPCALEHMLHPEAYHHLLVKDLLRRLPKLPGCLIEGNPVPDHLAMLDDEDVPVRAGLLRADGEWGAWAFEQGTLTLYIRDMKHHRKWDTLELEKLFVRGDPDYRPGEDTPFALWPHARTLDLTVLRVEKELIKVSADDMAAAALHAVECAVTREETPDSWPMKHIRERHREIIAHDASIGAALYDLFRRSRQAAEMAVRLAASSDGIVQIS